MHLKLKIIFKIFVIFDLLKQTDFYLISNLKRTGEKSNSLMQKQAAAPQCI